MSDSTVQYVDKTGKLLHRRMNSHQLDIVHCRTDVHIIPVGDYFNGNVHSIVDMTVLVINQIWSHDPCLCEMRESRWIRTLESSHPMGTNPRVESL